MKKITHWVLGTATARVSGDTARFTSRPDAYVLKTLRRRRRSPCLKSLKIRRL